ncbi:MAG: hypothetical protein V1820_01965 [archaeon]
MAINVTIIDHHRTGGRELKKEWAPSEGFSVPELADDSAVREKVWEHIDPERNRPDLVIGDTDPDGLSSLALYSLLFSPPSERPRMVSTRRNLDSGWLSGLGLTGDGRILEFDRYMIYYTNYSKPPGFFGKVTLLNPTVSGMSDRFCGTNIVYQAVLPHIPENLRETALTVAAIGVASDYGASSPQGDAVLREFAGEYADCVPKLSALFERGGKVTDQQVMATEMGRLSDIFWAPLVITGDDGSYKSAGLIADNPGFSVRDLLRNEGSGNPAVAHFRQYEQLLEAEMRRELASFGRNAKFVHDPANPDEGIIFHVMESQYPLLGSLISTRVSDKFPGYVVAWGNWRPDGTLGYSLRRQVDSRTGVNLGAIASEMGFGGGSPSGAGARGITDRETFETEFARRVYASEGKLA